MHYRIFVSPLSREAGIYCIRICPFVNIWKGSRYLRKSKNNTAPPIRMKFCTRAEEGP